MSTSQNRNVQPQVEWHVYPWGMAISGCQSVMVVNIGNITLTFFAVIPLLSSQSARWIIWLALPHRLKKGGVREAPMVSLSLTQHLSSLVDLFMGKQWWWPSPKKQPRSLGITFLIVNLHSCENTFSGTLTTVYLPPLLLPRETSPLCLLNTSSLLDESRASDPEPWKIHQSKYHLVSLMTPLITQHVLLSQTSTATCDYHKYFTHSSFILAMWGRDWS